MEKRRGELTDPQQPSGSAPQGRPVDPEPRLDPASAAEENGAFAETPNQPDKHAVFAAHSQASAQPDEQRVAPTDRGALASQSEDLRNSGASEQESLLPEDSLGDFQERWEAIQVSFVDRPRDAVRQAESLVGELVDRVTEVFTRERESLERTWVRGENVSTEDLRLALQRYRSFFQRLLAT